MADEPPVARPYSMGPAANLNIQTEVAQKAVSDMAAAMKSLEKALQDFGNNAYTMAEKINRHLKSIGDTASTVAGQLSAVGTAISGAAGATGNTATTAAVAAGATGTATTGSSRAAGWVSSATSAIDRVVNKDIAGGLSLGTFVGTGGGEGASGLVKDLALSPLRYLRSRINTNRDTAIMASGALNMAAMQQGTNTGSMMGQLAKFPGSIYGTPQDMMQLFANAPALGASYNFGGEARGQGVRAAGMFRGIREMQMMNPMAQVGGEGGLMSQLGGYAADTGAQQRSMMLTGGAMGIIGAGGRQKSLSEWAESILRWFEGLRPGKDRGKGFDYGSLMAQYFPGSNIDAWFQVNSVPQNMRDYWWTYALGKASKSPDTSKQYAHAIQPDENNVAWQRLRAGSELTRTEFSLAGKMSGQYAQRESSNRWFNELMGSVQETIIPALSKSIFRWIQFLPDSLEDLMMTGAERGMSALLGDVGDIGDSVPTGANYGAVGGTSLSGLHPDMRAKVGRMMQANPRLRMTSGLRDTGLQERLRSGGNNRVSGRPSAHTRGMAADLGPRSEYGWIVKNAKKFGLASGRNHGEPWHVGMPGDVPGVGDVFDDFIDSIKGIASSPEGMAGFITKMISTMTGALGKLIGAGGAEEPGTAFAQDPEDLYKRLAGASRSVSLGIPVGGGGGGAGGVPNATGSAITATSGGESVAGTPSGWSANGITWKGMSASGRGDKYNMTASPDIVSDIQSSDPVTRGKAVAKALHNAGFSGDTLRNFMRISYRESHWLTNQWVEDSDDIGGGILGINQRPWWIKNPKQSAPFTQADVLDPQASAYIAHDMFTNTPPVNGPGGYSPWTVKGNWQGNIPAEAAGYTERALQATGLGDIEAMQATVSMPTRPSGGSSITFNNQFTIGGVSPYGGGPNGGIDIRRTVNLIADHLEGEMKRRLARTA